MVQFLKQDGGLNTDEAGEAVLVDVVAVVLARKEDGTPVYGVADRLKAAATSLPFLKAKPESKTAVRVETAEDFFAAAAKAADEHGQP